MNTSEIKKGQQGFTLVEVIVVAIIVAALAAVAVPMYTSYVTSSRTNAAANAAGSVASFMGACINQAGGAVGVTENAQTAGTAPITVDCKAAAGTGAILSSMQLPEGIKFTIEKLNTTGSVKAIHTAGGTEQTYKY